MNIHYIPQYHAAGIETLIIPKQTPLVIGQPSNKLLRWFYPIVKIFQKTINFIKFFFISAFKIVILLKEREIKLIHLNNSIIRNNDWMLATKLIGVPCITHERGINSNYHKIARYFAPRLRAVPPMSG